MKHNLKHVQTLVALALCVIVSMSLTSCGDDDDDAPSSTQAIEGEWIKTNGNIYYQFLPDVTGRYICLADEPGYDPEYPEAVIKNPVDPYYFDYTVDGDILTMKEYASIQNKDDYTIYVYDIVVSKDVLQMKCIRTSDNGVDWDEYDYRWETFNRWTARK